MRDHDVIVIGTGAAGATVAADCATAGLSVAVTDRAPYGGTCAQRGCDPKKVLLAAAEAVGRAQALSGDGLGGSVAIEWPALMERKRRFVEAVPARTEDRLRAAGATLLHGPAVFVDRESVEVGGERLRGEHIVVATGARPRPLGVPGEDLLTDSTAFMELNELPPRVVFVGGGYISMEFAALACRAGAQVTIVHRSDRVLKGFDSDLAALLVERYRTLGIEFVLEAPLRAVERIAGGYLVRTATGDLEANLVVHGAGRVPDIDGLDLAAAGVDRDRHGVLVDAQLRSISNPRVFAAGDAAATGLPLTPAASRQAWVVVRTILGEQASYDPRGTASVAFSDPPLAAVGMTAAEAEGQRQVDVLFSDMSSWFTQRRLGQTHAAAKVISEKGSGRILGAHVLGVNADEVINVFALAVRQNLTVQQVRESVWGYPTAGSDIAYML